MVKATINKWGNALAVRIPKEFCEQLSLHASDEVRITLEEDRIVIEPMDSQYTLENRLKNWKGGRYHSPEIDWGPPVGKEMW